MSKETIINRIISDAQANASGIIAEAEARAVEITEAAERTAMQKTDAFISGGEEYERDTLSRALSLAELEIKKHKLETKQAVIDKAFSEAGKAFVASAKYKEFLTTLINKYAEKGDTLILNKEDRAKYKDISGAVQGVSVSDTNGDFMGGLILSSQKYDKIATLDIMLADIRREKESEIVKILFK